MSDLAGKIAVVSGGTGGMGQAIATLFAEKGATVYVCGRDAVKVDASVQSIGTNARPITLDVTDGASWQAAADGIAQAHGKLDILVNASGLSYGSDIETGTLEDLRRHMQVNVEAVFLGCQLLLPLLCKAGGKASIVNIGSVIAARPAASLLAYGASKAAMASMTKAIALHCAQKRMGIRVNALHPGGIQTEMFESALVETGLPREEAYALWRDTHPIGRIGTPQEIADAVLWLASDSSSFVTGADIHVDGGAAIRS